MDFVRGVNHTTSAAYTRPADTNTYAAGDVVNNSTTSPVVLSFPAASKELGGMGIIQQATLYDAANVATKADLELWLFNVSPTIPNDNAAFAPSNAELLNVIGVIKFSTNSYNVGAVAGNSVCDVQGVGIAFNTAKASGAAGVTPADDKLYGILVVRNAYVPVSGEVFTINLRILD